MLIGDLCSAARMSSDERPIRFSMRAAVNAWRTSLFIITVPEQTVIRLYRILEESFGSSRGMAQAAIVTAGNDIHYKTLSFRGLELSARRAYVSR